MTTSANLVIGTALALLVITALWRLASRRHSLPCPVWLRWMVELGNPFTKTNRARVGRNSVAYCAACEGTATHCRA